MKLRDFLRRLEEHGCTMRQGKGRHINIFYKGKNLSVIPAGQKEVGPGTVIAFERRLGIDLDGINPRKTAGAADGAATRKDAGPALRGAVLSRSPSAPATTILGSPEAGDGNTRTPTAGVRDAAGVASNLPRTADAATPANPLGPLADSMQLLAHLITADKLGVRLRAEGGEIILEYIDINKRGALVRCVAVGRDLPDALAKARARI
jgi:hypothetical protein